MTGTNDTGGLEATVNFNGAWSDRIRVTCDNGPGRTVTIKVGEQTVSQIVVLHGDDFDRIIAEYARFNDHAEALAAGATSLEAQQ